MNRIKFASNEKLPKATKERAKRSIQSRIIAGRKKLYPEESNHRVTVHRAHEGNMFDVLEMVAIAIGVSFTVEGQEYGNVVALRRGQDTRANIDKAIQYLIKWKHDHPLAIGIPVAPDNNFRISNA